MRLADCFTPLMAYVAYFLRAHRQRDFGWDEVRSNIGRLLAESEQKALAAGFSLEDYNEARFAVCAWVDEMILNSDWKEKGRWQREQLQRLYYNTTNAGEEFFEHLSSLDMGRRDVREVYYLCLALGFQGQYCRDTDRFLLEQLTTSNLKLLFGNPVELPDLKEDLFPHAYPPPSEEGIKGGRFSLSPLSIAFIVGPVVLFALLYVIYRFVLGGIAQNVLSLVG